MNCVYKNTCINSPSKCFRCSRQELYNPGKKNNKYKYTKKRYDSKKANDKDSWKDLEEQVTKELNNIPNIEQARRTRASGALWFEKGDIKDSILHPECKERTAEKSFSIKRTWLEKALKEAQSSDKIMCLPFRFKGDEQIYTIFRNEDIMELITLMKSYMHDNEVLRKQLELLKNGE